MLHLNTIDPNLFKGLVEFSRLPNLSNFSLVGTSQWVYNFGRVFVEGVGLPSVVDVNYVADLGSTGEETFHSGRSRFKKLHGR
jgi:hypothetical protein